MSKKQKSVVNQEPTGQFIVSPLEQVLHNSMLPYAEYVILDRALPRVEDGLKPVQRRILYTMNEMGLTPDKPHKKCARIVGDCMGKYHPHGDSSVYDAMVRLAQDFNMGQTLVDGHGNFGSVDGDSAAAMRYTEARMAPLALEMLRDLDKDTVPWQPNFDDSLKEPTLLPGRIPNLLVNGAYGIAVGLATNIPPHNLSEVVDGVIAYIDNPKMKLDQMISYIPAPDFPTGGYIIANELYQAYDSGKGKITIRAKMHVEADGDKKLIVITEIPYQVNKATLLRKIAELRGEKKYKILESVVDIMDESDRSGMRAVIKVKGDTNIDELLAFLRKNTDLEISFGINMVAIADGKPQQLGLMQIIGHYVEYQREVILRRSKYDLAQAKERCHILEGLIVAVRNIDEVIAIIKKSESTSDARQKLRERFELSERQAQAILDLRLARLTKLEIFKLEKELEELKKLIDHLTKIVGSNRLQLKVVKEELLEIRKKFRRPRRSELVLDDKEIKLTRKDEKQPATPCILCAMADGSLKCVSEKNYNMSYKGVNAKSTPNNIIRLRQPVLSDRVMLVFSDMGTCYKVPVEELSCKLSDEGFTLFDLFDEAKESEKAVAFFEEGKLDFDLLFITQGGMLKRTEGKEYSLNKPVYQAIRLNEGDSLLGVEKFIPDEDNQTVFFVTQSGNCLNSKTDDIPVQGRVAGGVKGIMLAENDKVVFAKQINGEGEIIVATKQGRFKRVISCQIDPSPRYRKGCRIITFSEKNDEIIFAEYVTEPYYLAVSDGEGNMLAYDTEDISIEASTAKGRKLKGRSEEVCAVYALKFSQ
ncbi:MAG: DNA topoisomerase 4 subunit A [Clostridia bacterium]|nr:DNA topoisomerase 4 subunit A [Clostridia bacterium]